MFRPVRSCVLLACVALGLLAAQVRAQPVEAGEVEDRRLHLFTWNVGTCNPMAFRLPEKSVPRVVETIARAHPEVITLQEVGSPAQAAHIVSALAAQGLRLRSAEVVVDTRRSDGRLAVTLYQGEGEVLTHRTSNGFGILALRRTGVTIVNIHAPISAPDRSVFFRELAEWVRAQSGPVIVQGDYNCGPMEGAGMAMLFDRDRERDFFSFNRFTRALPVGTRPEPTNLFGLSIDHVRLTAGRVLSQKVHKGRRIFPMDHDPLEAEVQVRVAVPIQPTPVQPSPAEEPTSLVEALQPAH